MNTLAHKAVSLLLLLCFTVAGFNVPIVQAQDFRLPTLGVMIHLSPEFNPPMLKGIKVYPENPFRFDFILDKGDKELSNDQIKNESSKLIKYFLASLTIPEKDLWVNLSPYEKDRIIPQSFGLTEMGCDLLAEDYILKQITASLIYPEDGIGKKFWKKIYEQAQKRFGTTNIPVNTFNKVWIVPQKAIVYENVKTATAYVVESKLKVMLEQDYLSLEKHAAISPSLVKEGVGGSSKNISALGSQIVREIVIPELTTEVNENKNFARLRQIFNSLILATWYKKKIKNSILSQIYTNKDKVAGVNIGDPQEKEKIYQRYLRAFKKGVYNYIKEDIDPITQETIPRKYFSGGVDAASISRLQTLEIMEEGTPLLRAVTANEDEENIISMTLTEARQEHSTNASIGHATGPLAPLTWIKYEDINTNDADGGLVALVTHLISRKGGNSGLGKRLSIKDYITRMRAGEKLIEHPPDPVAGTIMGDIDLARLNNIELYNKPTIVADLLRDLWVADQLGLLNIDLGSRFSFNSVYKALRGTKYVDENSFPLVSFEDYWIIRHQMAHQVLIHKDAYQGKAGEVRFMRELTNAGKIREKLLIEFYTALDATWVKELGWGKMYGSLKEAEKVRELVAELVEDPGRVMDYQGNPGQVKFVRDSINVGEKISDNLGHFYSYLDTKWVNDLGWEYVDLPLFEAEKARALVAELVKDPGQVEKYNGNTGQIRFVGEKYTARKLRWRHLGYFHKVLNKEWVEALGWTNLNMKLDEAKRSMKAMITGTRKFKKFRKAKRAVGGIDLTPVNTELQGRNNGGEIKFRMDPVMLQQFQDAPGFVPEITNIQPMRNIRTFLGLKEIFPTHTIWAPKRANV